jgi:ABC-2 type transport system permease protein
VNTFAYTLSDSRTMFLRTMRHTTRNQTELVMSVIIPSLVLLLLNYAFGGAINTGGVKYIDYLVPGIIVLGSAYSVSTTAVSVASDNTGGIINRFRTMPIARSAVLTGHAVGSTVRALLGTAFVVLIGLAIGYRPTTNALHWLEAIGLVALMLFAFAWIATAMGLATGTPSGASSLAAILQLLPFLSGAFVPAQTMPGWLQAFAANQPMTQIVTALRGLLGHAPIGNHGWLAVAWCVGIALFGRVWAGLAFRRPRTR